MFIVRRDKHIVPLILIIKTIKQLQYILRIEHPHIPCFLFNLIDIHSIHHDGFNSIDLSILYSLTFFYIPEATTTDFLLCDIVLLFRANGEFTLAQATAIAATYIIAVSACHSSKYNY